MKNYHVNGLFLHYVSLRIFKLPGDGSPQKPKHVAKNKAV
jgi:hypothetical protein